MIYILIAAIPVALVIGLMCGYYIGRYHTSLLERIAGLQAKKDAAPEPEKPTVVGGAYQPPKEMSTTVDKKHGAGLVETKTPELLDWESQEELHKLEHA